jgi:hypothetical protein
MMRSCESSQRQAVGRPLGYVVMMVNRIRARGYFIGRPELIVGIVELVNRLVVAVTGEDHGLVVVAILDMSEWSRRLFWMQDLVSLFGHHLGALVLLDCAGTFRCVTATTSVAISIRVRAVFLVVSLVSSALAIDMLAARLALASAVLAL